MCLSYNHSQYPFGGRGNGSWKATATKPAAAAGSGPSRRLREGLPRLRRFLPLGDLLRTQGGPWEQNWGWEPEGSNYLGTSQPKLVSGGRACTDYTFQCSQDYKIMIQSIERLALIFGSEPLTLLFWQISHTHTHTRTRTHTHTRTCTHARTHARTHAIG